MESTPRTVTAIATNLEQRLENFQRTRVYDDQTLNEFESFINECSNHLNHLLSSSDSTLVAILLPSLLNTIISLSKLCVEKSDTVTSLPKEKLMSLTTLVKTLHNQIKEFIKSPKLNNLLIKSNQLRHFCEKLRQTSDTIASIDIVTTLICHKLIVKLLTNTDDEQSSSAHANDGLIVAVYNTVLQQMNTICSKNLRDKSDNNRESPTTKMYGIYFQMISKLIQYNDTISQIENYQDFHRVMIQLHVCLESTCQQNRFQLEFFNSSIILQEVFEHFIDYSFKISSKLFFDDLFHELESSKSKYASLIIVFRSIEAVDVILSKQPNSMAVHIIHRLICFLYNLIDDCRMQLVIPALLPVSFRQTQVEYGSLYDIAYSSLLRLSKFKSMQVALSSMNRLILLSTTKTSSIMLTSAQLSSELIIQTWYLHNHIVEYQYLYGLFLSQLLHNDIYSNLVNYLLAIKTDRQMKFYAYDAFISSNTFNRIHDLYSMIENHSVKPPMINAKNVSLLYPTTIEHLYGFVRLFHSELTLQQIQYIVDACIYSIQQFLSLPVTTEVTCRNFIRTLRILCYLNLNNQAETFKCLLGQLTQLFILLDEQTATDIRLELLNVFSQHSDLLDDNDIGRLLDFMLTNTIETTTNSIAFHMGCLNVVDSLRQRPSRTANITDLIIQLIVRYGNEHQCSPLLKVHLMKTFMAYVTSSNDESLPMRVKSQCVLLRANIDEFDKIKKSIGTATNRYLNDNILKLLDTTRPSSIINEHAFDMKFFQTINNEFEFHVSAQNSNAMQQD